MKVEIVCPNGTGSGTRVYLDGEDISAGIRNLALEIPADGVAVMTVTRYVLNDDGKPKMEGSRDSGYVVSEEVLRFTGEFASVTTEAIDRVG